MASIAELVREKMDEDGPMARVGVDHLYMAAVGIVFVFAFWVRALPASGMQYLQALDPYMIARMSAAIVEHGSLPAVDAWRFFPYPTPTYLLNLGNIYIPAYLFELASLVGLDFLAWAKLYPALMGALAIFPMYLLGAEVFDRKTGLLASFFLATSTAVMQRSSAGWFEKEPIAQLLMLSSMYLFARAWNRYDWRAGIGAGLFLGVAATTWGGAKYLFLLYPLVVFMMAVAIPMVMSIPTLMFGSGLREFDFYPGLTAAFVPTAVLGSVVPWILNGSASTWSLPNSFFVVNMAATGLLVARYGFSKYDTMDAGRRVYAGIGLFVAGLFAAALSPLYAPRLYSYIERAINSALQSNSAVIGGTVAENAPAAMNNIISQLGASLSAAMIPGASVFSEYVGGWTFGILGASFLVLMLFLMLARFYYDVESINRSVMIGLFASTVSALSLLLYTAFATANLDASAVAVLSGGVSVPSFYVAAFTPAIVIASFGSALLFLAEYIYSEDFEQWIGVTVLMWTAIFVIVIVINAFEVMALLGIAGGMFMVSFRDWADEMEIEVNWLYVFILLWIASTVYGALQKSRLLFLAASPVAMGAGVGVARMIDAVGRSSVWERIAEALGSSSSETLFRAAVGVVLLVVVAVNVSAVYVMSAGTTVQDRSVGGIGGSPNDLWMENLEYMRDETPPGSVVLSWWDYGYWFETIGERPAVADGGNMGYYTNENVTKINYPLADFLTSQNASEWRGWLDERSVDYIVLDSTMIGKYSAVSQISRRSNTDFNRIPTFDCVRQDGRCRVSEMDNQTVINYRFGRGGDILVPVEQRGRQTRIVGAPLIRAGQQQARVANICVPGRGIMQVTDDAGTTGGFNEAVRSAVRQGRPFGGCVALHPQRGAAQLVMAPPEVMGSTLSRLYLMDGAGIDFVEEAFNNGFVKMWKVKG